MVIHGFIVDLPIKNCDFPLLGLFTRSILDARKGVMYQYTGA